jgi:hypothetical protein
MKLTRFAVLAVIALVGAVACEEDITSNGDSGEPFAIVANRSQLTVTRNNQFTITAYTIDANNRRVPGELTAVAAGPAVQLDSVKYVQELSETRIFTRGITVNAAGTDVVISGHGLADTVLVIVN